MSELLVELYRHNLWANLRMADACAGLTEGQLDASVHGTAGSIRATLLHIAGAEQRYVSVGHGTAGQREAVDQADRRVSRRQPLQGTGERGDIGVVQAARVDPADTAHLDRDPLEARSTTGKRCSRSSRLICLESLSSRARRGRGARVAWSIRTPAATRGPASEPRPASSAPAT